MADEVEIVIGKRSRNKSKSYDERPEEFEGAEEPDFNDPEGYVEDISEEGLYDY